MTLLLLKMASECLMYWFCECSPHMALFFVEKTYFRTWNIFKSLIEESFIVNMKALKKSLLSLECAIRPESHVRHVLLAPISFIFHCFILPFLLEKWNFTAEWDLFSRIRLLIFDSFANIFNFVIMKFHLEDKFGRYSLV